MLELEDIEILPESMPPPATESAPVWTIVAAVVIVLLIAALVARALTANAKKGPDHANALDRARNEFLQISQSLDQPTVAESLPTVIHAWAEKQLDQKNALPENLVTEMTRTRDLLSPFRYQPAARWHQEIDSNAILGSLASALKVEFTPDQKGGRTSDA